MVHFNLDNFNALMISLILDAIFFYQPYDDMQSIGRIDHPKLSRRVL